MFVDFPFLGKHSYYCCRCAANDDIITVKAQDEGDTVTFVFENPRPLQEVSNYEMKLMNLDHDLLGIPGIPRCLGLFKNCPITSSICLKLSSFLNCPVS